MSAPLSSPSLSPRVGVRVRVSVGVGLALVYLVLEYEVFREEGLGSRYKILELLTYEDVSACISLTLSPCMHTNVQLKTRSHTRVRVFFLTKTYLYLSFVI